MASRRQLARAALGTRTPLGGGPGVRGRRGGYFTASDMAPEFFAYMTRFDGAVMVSDVVVCSRDGAPQRYVERWEPLDADRFRWSLIEVTSEGNREAYDAVYTRR